MKGSIFLLVLSLTSCMKQPHFRIDLGDLSDPQVQEKVASRERDRARITADSTRVVNIVSRLQLMAQFYNETMPTMKQDQVNTCAIQLTLFQLALINTKVSLALATNNGEHLVKRIQKSDYRFDDATVVAQFAELETSIEKIETDANDSRLKLIDFFRCMGVRVRLVNPENPRDVILDTGEVEHPTYTPLY